MLPVGKWICSRSNTMSYADIPCKIEFDQQHGRSYRAAPPFSLASPTLLRVYSLDIFAALSFSCSRAIIDQSTKVVTVTSNLSAY